MPMSTTQEQQKLIASLKRRRGEVVTYYPKNGGELPNITLVIDRDVKRDDSDFNSRVTDNYILATIELADVGMVLQDDELETAAQERFKLTRLQRRTLVYAVAELRKLNYAE